MYGGTGRGEPRSPSGKGRGGRGGIKASKHQVGTSQSGSGLPMKMGSKTDWWGAKNKSAVPGFRVKGIKYGEEGE